MIRALTAFTIALAGVGPALAEDGPLTADGAAAIAARVSPDVARAAAQTGEREADLDRAALGFLPRVSVSASYTRVNELDLPDLDLGGGPSPNPFPQILDRWALQGGVEVPVSAMLLTTRPQHRAAAGFVDAARLSAESARRSAALAGAEAYFDYSLAVRAAALAEATITTRRRLLDETRVRLSERAALAADVAQFAADLAAAEAQLAAAESRQAVAAMRLARRLGRTAPPPAGFALAEGAGPSDAADASVEALVARALAARPEAKALTTSMQAHRDSGIASDSRQLPQLGLNGSVGTLNPNPAVIPLQERFDPQWSVGAVLSWSPNSALDGRAAARAAQSRSAQLAQELARLEDRLAVEITRALADGRAAARQLSAARAALSAAEAAAADREAAFKAGRATATMVTTAVLSVTRARLAIADAEIAAARSRFRLRYALGDPIGAPAAAASAQ